MHSERSRELFRQLLQARALEQYGADDLTEVALCLLEEAELSEEQTEAIMMDEPVALDGPSCERLALAFALHVELLQALLLPTSDEIVTHVLRTVAAEQQLSEGCPECQQLAAATAALSRESTRADLELLSLQMLAHLIEQEDPEDERVLDELYSVLAQLDRPARLRLLAAAYEEQERQGTERRDSVLSALARYRADFLSPLAREAFDALARAEEGTLTRTELRQRLGVTEEALAGLDRSFQRAWRLFVAAEGTRALEVAPVIKTQHGRGQRFRIQAPLLRIAQLVLRAEEALRDRQD